MATCVRHAHFPQSSVQLSSSFKGDGISLSSQKTDRVRRPILRQTQQLSKASNWSGSWVYAAGDLLGIFRNGAFFFRGSGVDPAWGLSGLAGATMIVSGGEAACNGVIQYERASKVDDYWGKFAGALTSVRGAVESLTGVSVIPMRLFCFAASKTTSSVILCAAKVFTCSTLGLYSGIYFLFLIPFIVNSMKAFSFGKQWVGVRDGKYNTKVEKKDAVTKFLKEKTMISESDREKLVDKLFSNTSRMEKVLKDYKADNIDALKSLTKEDISYILKRVIPLQLSSYEKDKLIQQLKIDFSKCVGQKEAQMQRDIGEESIDTVKTFLRGSETDQVRKLDNVIESVDKGNRYIKILGLVVVAISVISVVGAILLLPFAWPAILPIIGIGLMFLSSALWMGVDGYFLYQVFKKEEPGRWDKALIYIMTIVVTLSIISVMVFSGGTAAFVIAGILLAIWIGFSSYTYYNIKKKEKAQEDKLKALQN